MRTLRLALGVGLVLYLVVLFVIASFAQETVDKTIRQTQARLKAAGSPCYTLLNINNIATWMWSDGLSSLTPLGREGTKFPRGTASVIYQDGMIWGGKAYTDAALTQPAPFNQLIRVGGAYYIVGTREGRVIGTGAAAVPVDPNAPEARIYRIRRDYFTMSEDELRRDAAEFNEIDPNAVGPAQMQAIRDQYDLDWRDWPVASGAPYIDRNRNGRYDPPPAFSSIFTVDDLIRGGYDEPGIAGANLNFPADQVTWTAYNDLDRNGTVQLLGSEPLGLEVQVTLWGYKNNPAMVNVFFRRVRIINKGGVQIDAAGSKAAFWIDSLYFGQWSDPDLGNLRDDLAGCDPSLNIGFVYNAGNVDAAFRQFNLPPPAIGYVLAQGPIVPAPGATAIFDMKRLNDFHNLPMTAFGYFATGSPFSDPPRDYARGTLRWYKLLRGFVPLDGPDQRYPFPPGMTPDAFPLSGDPVAGTGFVDGQGTQYSFAPDDRRIVMSSGPFRLAPGDTQEVVLAGVGGLGADRLSSITAMRQNMHIVQGLYDRLLTVPVPPEFSVQVGYPTANLAEVKLTASGQAVNATAMTAILKQPDGTQVTETALFDDGIHGDGAANDGIFANTVTISRRPVGLYVDARATDNLQMTQIFERVLDMVTTAGPVDLDTPEIFSDNLNKDNKANPGENVRYGFFVHNQTDFRFSNLRLSPAVEFEIGKTITIASLGAGQAVPFLYNANDPNSYFSFQVPLNFTDPLLRIPFVITDNQNNLWLDTLAFAIVPGPSAFIEVEINHVAGKADGTFFLRIIDRISLKNHEYAIIGVDSINAQREPGLTLQDRTDNRILLLNHPLPDTLGHNMPVTDGFKILRGTIPDQSIAGMRDWSIPNGVRVWTWANADIGFEGFNGAIGWDEPYHLFGGGNKTLKASDLKNTLIKFAEADAAGNVLNPNDLNWSYGYRYGRGFASPPAKPEFAPFIVNPSPGYAYQDYKKSVPFSAWDVESNPPRRLMVGHLENNVAGGLVDGKYWPPSFNDANNTTGSGPREWFFIFDVTYSETPDPRLTKDILSNPVPIMWWGTPARRSASGFTAGNEFLIIAWHVITSRDLWLFNPITVGVAEQDGPLTFALAQNYPNPFNPETHIAFSLPISGKVSLKILNVLGQEVATLVDKKLTLGKYVEVWQGRNRFGNPIASGVYFYRLEVKDLNNESTSRFVQTRKMILLR